LAVRDAITRHWLWLALYESPLAVICYKNYFEMAGHQVHIGRKVHYGRTMHIGRKLHYGRTVMQRHSWRPVAKRRG
jgi:hypothetical protein